MRWARWLSCGCGLRLNDVCCWCVQERVRFALSHEREEFLELHAEVEEPEPPAEAEWWLGENVAGEDGDDGVLDLQRALTFHEKLAEGMAVVGADEAPEDGGA